jgi:AmmeMemoRadiSam system protein A
LSIDAATRGVLLAIARSAIDAAVRGGVAPALPVNTSATAILAEERGVFVTLTRSGRLRGCIGRVEPDIPLAALLPLMAVMSATRDPRFPAVATEELGTLCIEISLLSAPTPLSNPAAIEIGRHGLTVFARGRRGLLLPQVATEYGWGADEFLAQTCAKAALPPDAWKHDGAVVHTFETEIIAE